MKAQPQVVSRLMPSPDSFDREARDHIRAWLWHYKDQRPEPMTNDDLANALSLAEPTITNILNGKRTGGLDVLARMRKKLHMDINDVIDRYPKTWDTDAPRTGRKVQED